MTRTRYASSLIKEHFQRLRWTGILRRIRTGRDDPQKEKHLLVRRAERPFHHLPLGGPRGSFPGKESLHEAEPHRVPHPLQFTEASSKPPLERTLKPSGGPKAPAALNAVRCRTTRAEKVRLHRNCYGTVPTDCRFTNTSRASVERRASAVLLKESRANAHALYYKRPLTTT